MPFNMVLALIFLSAAAVMLGAGLSYIFYVAVRHGKERACEVIDRWIGADDWQSPKKGRRI